MKTNSSSLLVAVIALCGFATNSTLAGDQKDIQGAWTLQKVSMNGKTMPISPVTYVFTGNNLTVRPEVGAEQRTTFTLETSKSKVMVVQHSDSAAGTKPDRMPYDLRGDTLRIAFVPPGDSAPDVTDNGQIVFILQRDKPLRKRP